VPEKRHSDSGIIGSWYAATGKDRENIEGSESSR